MPSRPVRQRWFAHPLLMIRTAGCPANSCLPAAPSAGHSPALPRAPDISNFGSYGLPSDGYFARAIYDEGQIARLQQGLDVSLGGRPFPDQGFPGGYGFLAASEDLTTFKTGAAFENKLQLQSAPLAVLEFQLRDTAGLQNVLSAPYPEFVYGGRTGAGFREFNYPGLNSSEIVNYRIRLLNGK